MLFALTALPACAGDSIEEDDADAQDNELNARAALFANDVSVLFSLPKGSESDLLLTPKSAGAKGELLPQVTFDKIPRLAADGAAREEMRVVALRIDPCFPGLGVEDPAGCKNQIRLVLQPIRQGATASDPITTKDAAVHAFYEMTRDEFGQMARELLAAKHGSPGSKRTALGIHPLIEQQGLNGVFAREVKDVVLKHAGKQNLTRVTFMTREPPRQGQWKFGGFDIRAGANATHTKMKIASLGNETEQTFVTLGRNGSVTPEVRHEDNISLFFRTYDADAATAANLKKAYTATLKIQNTANHSPDTIDCVSCHTATSARIWAEKTKGQSPDGNPAVFTTTWNTKLTKSPAAERPDNLHSFGYHFSEVSISQRTANESAAVADYVNAKILGQR